MMNTRAVAARYSHILRSASPETLHAGIVWYDRAHRTVIDIALENGVTVWQSAGVMAALSPRVHWVRNVNMTREYFTTGKISGMSRSKRAADAVMAGGVDTLRGRKTNAFAHNLAGDYSRVTIDMWMAIAAGLDPNKGISASDYATISGIVTRLAHRNNLTPAQVQAIIWVAQRGRAD
jgi:hypothetical protein